eukprot:1197843-Prymnesium_polylepis.1
MMVGQQVQAAPATPTLHSLILHRAPPTVCVCASSPLPCGPAPGPPNRVCTRRRRCPVVGHQRRLLLLDVLLRRSRPCQPRRRHAARIRAQPRGDRRRDAADGEGGPQEAAADRFQGHAR